MPYQLQDYNFRNSRILFAATDILGSLLLWGGLVFAVYGIFAGFPIGSIWSASISGGGLSLLIATHIGRAIIHIAESNSKILQRLQQMR